MLERRAAQLAAAAEAVDEHPLLVSSGPEVPEMERWLQRQLSQDGERLQHLRSTLWQDLRWKRTDRVLMLGGTSLLWSLDPLANVADGGLTILCQGNKAQDRLNAQLQLLDPLQRPSVVGTHRDLETLATDHHFEVVGGRLNHQDLERLSQPALLQQLQQRCGPKAQLRLLVTNAGLGPTAALLQLHALSTLDDQEQELLQHLLQREQAWLNRSATQETFLEALQHQGWQLQHEHWEETLNLPIDSSLRERWLGKDRPYGQVLSAGDRGKREVALLTNLLVKADGQPLPQMLRHQRIVGLKAKSSASKNPGDAGAEDMG
jgi:putative ATPase